jgi:hypothetical protein
LIDILDPLATNETNADDRDRYLDIYDRKRTTIDDANGEALLVQSISCNRNSADDAFLSLITALSFAAASPDKSMHVINTDALLWESA